MYKCHLRYAKVFNKCTCIGNDWEARKNVRTAKIFKKVCKTLFVTVTILSPNFLLKTIASKSWLIHVKLWKTFT